MKKSVLGLIAFFFVLLSTAFSIAEGEKYVAKKIVLGTYKTKGPGSLNLSWSYVKTHEIDVDDNHRTYVLDRTAKRVLIFNPDGNHMNDIHLKNVDLTDRSNEEGEDSYIAFTLRVQADGNKFYITEGGKETNWAIVDSNGIPIKKNICREFYWLERICKSNNFRSTQDKSVIDENLNIIRTIPYKIDRKRMYTVDSSNNIYSTNRAQKANKNAILEKVTAEGKLLWKKEIDGCKQALRFVGTDGENNVYLLVDAPLRILKLNQGGNKLAEIPIPNEPYFKKWEMVSWHVLCDGTIYCIPTYWALFNSNKNKNPNEFAMYFFERK